jgi:hypothetical protein
LRQPLFAAAAMARLTVNGDKLLDEAVASCGGGRRCGTSALAGCRVPWAGGDRVPPFWVASWAVLGIPSRSGRAHKGHVVTAWPSPGQHRTCVRHGTEGGIPPACRALGTAHGAWRVCEATRWMLALDAYLSEWSGYGLWQCRSSAPICAFRRRVGSGRTLSASGENRSKVSKGWRLEKTCCAWENINLGATGIGMSPYGPTALPAPALGSCRDFG